MGASVLQIIQINVRMDYVAHLEQDVHQADGVNAIRVRVRQDTQLIVDSGSVVLLEHHARLLDNAFL